MTLPDLAVKRPVTTAMLLISMTVLGAVALARLPLAFMPDFESPELFIRVPYANASPEQVERTIVRPVEEAVGTVRGVKSMWAICNDDGGVVGLNFDWTVDMRIARVEVWERLDRVKRDLPDDIGDITVSPTWNDRQADQPIVEGRLSSPRDLSESYDVLERRIVRPLQRVPGVAQVRLDGVLPKQVRINLRVDALERHDIDVRDVERLLRTSNFDQSVGRIVTTDEQRLTLRTVASFDSVERIRNLPLRSDDLRLKDIADVEYEEPPLEYGRHLDGDFAIGISISQESKANTVEVGQRLDEQIAKMAVDPELESVNFLIWFSQADEIRSTLTDLATTGIFGALLATVVLFAFLRRLSSTIVSVLCVPFSLLVTCGLVWVQGKTLNTITLLGLIVGVGMLVDNAVVVIENIFRHTEEGEDRKTAALNGARQVSTAVIAATMTSVIVFIPLIFSKPNRMNLILQELAITISITLLASLFVSQTLIPLAAASFIRSKPQPRGSVMKWVEARYTQLLQFNLRYWFLTPIIGLSVLASAYYPYLKVDMNLSADSTDVFAQIKYDFSEPLSLKRREAVVNQVEAAIQPHREALMTRSIYSFWSEGFAVTRIYLTKGEANEDNLAVVRRRLRTLLPEIPGVSLDVSSERNFWRADRGKRIAFQIVGDDSSTLAELAKEARRRLDEIPGLLEAFNQSEEGGREVHVKLDRELLARYQVPPEQPGRVVDLTYRGRRLPRYRTGDGEREMVMLLGERDDESIDQLHDLKLRGSDDRILPLAAVADFEEVPGPRRIQRDSRLTSVWVGARYEEGTKDDYVEPVKAALAEMEFPYGYSWTFGRWQSEREEKSREFFENLLLALLLIFALMAGLFESPLQALSLMVALPFALSGAAWCLYFTGTDFDQPAAVGLLLLIGIVVNNGIVMVEHINMYRRQGMPRNEAMLRGGRERLRPVLMTAMTTLIGLVPMLIQKPSLGGIYYYSIALVIMGGLSISTFLTTVLLPTTICLVEDVYTFVTRLFVRLRLG